MKQKYITLVTRLRDSSNPFPGRITFTETVPATGPRNILPPDLHEPTYLPPPCSYEKFRKKIWRLPERERQFLLACWHAVYDLPGPENATREKILKRLKIGARMGQKLVKRVR